MGTMRLPVCDEEYNKIDKTAVLDTQDANSAYVAIQQKMKEMNI